MPKFRFQYHSAPSGNSPFGANWLGLLLARWLILTAAIMLSAHLIDNIYVSGFLSAFFAAAVIGVLNLFFRPILIILTLPINILTLGLFTFIINALMLKIASGLIPGFSVSGFWSTVIGAIILSAINWILNMIVKDTRGPRSPGSHRREDDSIDMHKKDGRWE